MLLLLLSGCGGDGDVRDSPERHLHAAMHAFLDGRTTLIIAHRLSAVRQADRILVFENGRVVESGAHDELIGRDGLYRKLYHSPA